MAPQLLEKDTRSLDEIYAAAQKESGPLIVAAGGDAQAQWDIVRTEFARRFPKIKLDLTVDFSKYHDSRIDRAVQAGKHIADIAFIQDLHVFPRWRDSNMLMRYKSATFDDIYNSHKDPSGAYTGATLWSFGRFLYNKEKVKNPPKNFLDLLKPEWKGKLVITYPNDDDAIGYLLSLAIARYGWEWLYELNDKQDVQWVRGTATPGYIIQEAHDPKATGGRPRPKEYQPRGERVLGFTTAGYPLQSDVLAWAEPEPTEQYMSWTQTACILNTTPRPETAKLFISWITSEEFQSWLTMGGNNPCLLRSINKKNGVPLLDDTDGTQLNGFRLYSCDRVKADWWRMQYESILDTAQGVNPLKVYDFDDPRAL